MLEADFRTDLSKYGILIVDFLHVGCATSNLWSRRGKVQIGIVAPAVRWSQGKAMRGDHD